MSGDRVGLLRRQFDLIWSLAEVHLAGLTTENCLWAPVEHQWSVHRGEDGRWCPDWKMSEPDPPPVPTIGWLTWHVGWWWGTVLNRLRGRPGERETSWPGDAATTVSWLGQHPAARVGGWSG